MRVYALTDIGRRQAKATPSSNMSPASQIIYFLARRGGSASDETIYQFAGLNKDDAISAIASLRSSHPPMVEVVG